MKGFLKQVTVSIACLFLTGGLLLSSYAVPAELARAATLSEYDKTAIEDDLKGVDLSAYKKDEAGEAQLINELGFMEYAYSEDEAVSRKYYGLYFYVYNPRALTFSTRSGANVVNMAVTYDAAGEPTGYANLSLAYLDCTDDGLFYKFRLSDPSAAYSRAKAYAAAHGERRYDVAGIQLWEAGKQNAEDHAVNKTFNVTGYASGCAADPDAESTLDIRWGGLQTLSLKVHHTYYRPDGTNGKNRFTQDSLHSVFFSVPNDILEKYGDIVAIHASWRDAVLKPTLVTGNLEAYNAILPYLGKSLRSIGTGSTAWVDGLDYMYLGGLTQYPFGDGGLEQYRYGYSYNIRRDDTSSYLIPGEFGSEIDTLYMMFPTDGGTDSADSFTVSSETIQNKVIEMSAQIGGDLFEGKYSRALFESIQEEPTDIQIGSDKTFSLMTQELSYGFWQKLAGHGYVVTDSKQFDGIKAITPVKPSDLSGLDGEIAERLLMAEEDVDSLKERCDVEGETVFLFRYQVSDYIAQEATLLTPTAWNGAWKNIDTNAYFFRETVNLDFEIIDVSFEANGKVTVIPVVMSPVDFFPSATPPVITTSDVRTPWWVWFAVAGGALLVALLIYAIVRKD